MVKMQLISVKKAQKLCYKGPDDSHENFCVLGFQVD